MASTTTKLSAAAKNGRGASAAQKPTGKASKTQRPSSPAPKGSKAAASVKKALAAVPPPAPVPAVRPVAAANAAQGSKTELKAQLGRLSSATSQISGLKRSLNKTFYDVGVLLNQIRNERLYEVKGYGSFESFVEREIDMNKVLCLKTARIAEAIQREHALAAGLERAVAAVSALDGAVEQAPAAPGSRPAGSPGGLIPLHKQ